MPPFDAFFPAPRRVHCAREGMERVESSADHRMTGASLACGNERLPRIIATLALVMTAVALLTAAPLKARAHGEVHEVIAKVTELIAARPNTAALYLQRAELYRADSDWAAAEGDYTRARQLDPELSAVDLAHGRMLADSRQFAKAREALDRYIRRQPADPAGFGTRATVHRQCGDPLAAAEDYRQAIAFSRTPDPELYLKRAASLREAGRQDEARATFDEGLMRLGPLATLTLAAVDLDREAGRFDDAIRRIDAIAEKLARKERWLVRRAEILDAAGRRGEARDSWLLAHASIESLPEERRSLAANAELLRKIAAALAASDPAAK